MKGQKKASKKPQRLKKKPTTTGVGLRLKNTTIDWITPQLDEEATSVPAKVRKWVEDREEEAKKGTGG